MSRLFEHSRSLVAGLRKLADACPACGNMDAENRSTYTRCPVPSCSNYSKERAFELQNGVPLGTISSPGTQEYKNNSNPAIETFTVSYEYKKLSDLDMPEPMRADLRNLLGTSIVYLLRFPDTFSHERIPVDYKHTASPFFSRVEVYDYSLFITNKDKNIFYTAELASMYALIDWLTYLFSSVGKQISAGISKMAYNEIARIVFEQDAAAALRLATRYQQELPSKAIHRLYEVVLEHGTPAEAYLFAKDVKAVDIRRLEQKVLASSDLPTIYAFAKNVEGANIKAAEQVILSSGNTKYISLFSQNVEGADSSVLDNALRMKSKRSATKLEA